MADNTQPALHRLITKRYMLAVVLIAILSSFAAYTLKSAISDVDNSAYVVNISGSKRMLSQHIALDIHRLYQQRFITNSEQDTTEDALTQHINKMGEANQQLASGQLKNNKTLEQSAAIRHLYFGDINLYDRVKQYLDTATQLIDTYDEQTFQTLMNQIDNVSENLLIDLDKAVNQYQFEGDERLRIIKNLEVGLWLITLLTLVLEVIFIFRPMAKEVIKSREAEQRLLNSLEEQVELRTYKLEAANKKLKDLASKDPLTNLNNRLTLEFEIEALIKGFHANQCPFGIALIDIDFFKKINDAYGHLAGDHVLKEFAEILQSQGRDSDKAYRVGGEEFVVILNRLPSERAQEIIQELINQTRSHHFNFEGQHINATISAGLYHTDLFPIANTRDLFCVIDKALYESKANGRDKLTLAVPI